MTISEKRKAVRVAKRLEVKFNAAAENTAITSNLSENGIFITTCKGVEPGHTIDIKMHLPGSEALFITGRVVRNIKAAQTPDAGAQKGMGVELITPSSNYINFIRSLLE